MSETAREAMDRSTLAAINLVRDACDLRGPSALRAGMRIRVGGEWVEFVRQTGLGDLVCVNDAGRTLYYPPTRGETFAWRWAA